MPELQRFRALEREQQRPHKSCRHVIVINAPVPCGEGTNGTETGGAL